MKQVDIYDLLPPEKPKIKNAFTGEPYMKGTPETKFEEKRRTGLALKKLHEGELIEFGEPHPITGKRQTRPRSVGTVYDIPPDNGTYCEDKVDHEGKEYVDVNELMKKWDPAGTQFSKLLTQGHVTTAGLPYDDYTDAPTFQEALDIAIHGKEQFAALPANIRNRFENDPVRFLQYVNDPSTLEEQYSLGIRIKKVEPPKDATLKDVVDAVKGTAKPPKTAGKGGSTDGQE